MSSFERVEVRFGGSDWVLPYWMERQQDLTGPDFVPASCRQGIDPTCPVNITHTEAVTIGVLGHDGRALVDPRGLVTPIGAGWSLDWWIGSDDGWQFPSRSRAVRQDLIDNAPVVETRMRIPGGDAVQRVYAALAASAGGGDEVAVVEIENQSPVPVAVAFAVRPFTPSGLGSIRRLVLDGATLLVDDTWMVVLPRVPPRWAASDGWRDSADCVRAGASQMAPFPALSFQDDLAQAAFVYPLPHTISIRAVIRLTPTEPGARRRTAGRRRGEDEFASLPSAQRVARGWRQHAESGMRIVVPPGRLADAIDAALCELLLAASGDDVSGPGVDATDLAATAAVVQTLDELGHHDSAERILAATEDRIALDGHLLGSGQRFDANGAVLVAFGRHVELADDLDLAERLAGVIAKAAHWVDKRRRSRRQRRSADSVGLLPEGAAPRWTPGLGNDCWFRDDLWGLAGMRAAATVLARVDQSDAASLIVTLADRFAADLMPALRASQASGTEPAVAAAPSRPLDGSILTLLDVLAEELDRAVDPANGRGHLVDNPWSWGDKALSVIRERFVGDPGGAAVVEATSGMGFSPLLTALLARAELRRMTSRTDQTPIERLQWLAAHAVAGTGWPEAINPRTGGGSRGTSDVLAAANFLRAVRQLFVGQSGDRLVLVPVFPQTWLGQSVEIHRAPTPFGRFSYAIRWHGDRPALLWELDSARDRCSPRIIAPGLDPAWSSSEPTGEALLAAPSATFAEFRPGVEETGESSR
ncbi:MAG: hypothetical protein N2037_02625 [Acidimicrobiales bacterium]|nr:hypothetical protein [Acidimicrobiales bacterium]